MLSCWPLLQQAVPPLFPWVPSTQHQPLSPQQEKVGKLYCRAHDTLSQPCLVVSGVRYLSGALLWTCRCWASHNRFLLPELRSSIPAARFTRTPPFSCPQAEPDSGPRQAQDWEMPHHGPITASRDGWLHPQAPMQGFLCAPRISVHWDRMSTAT